MSRDRENCESLEESGPKAVPRSFPNHVVWSRALEGSVKSCVMGPETKCHFNEFLFTRGGPLHMVK